MSFFSDKFREAVSLASISVAEIAEECGISAAMLYKIQSGTRLPDSVETLNRLLDAVHCSLPMRRQIIQEYLVCRIGKHRYECMQEFKTMLAAFVTPPLLATEVHYDPEKLPPTAIMGEGNVSAAIQQLLEMEAALPGGQIRLFMNLSFSQVFASLCQALSHCHPEFDTAVHLFCLKSSGAADVILDNMKVFRSVLPQMARLKHYVPRYCYLPDPNDGTVPFPYFIITSHGVLLLSSDHVSALFLQDPEVRMLYLLEFRRMDENFRDCMEPRASGMETYFHGFHQIVGRHDPASHRPVIIASLPCVLPCVNPEAAISKLPPEMLGNEEMLKIAGEYFQGAAIGGYETFFSAEGMEHLLNTGELMELQGDFVPRAPRDMLLDAFDEFLRRAKAGLIVPHMFKTSLIPVTTRFSCTLRGRELMLYFASTPREAVFTTLAENTLAYAAAYYAENAELLGDVHSPEESIAIMEGILRKYRT